MNRIAGVLNGGLWLLGLAILLIAQATARPSHAATKARTACVTASSACSEWVKLGPGGARAQVYRTFPLGRRDARIRRALIVIHGALRNADHYYATGTSAAFLARALDDTLVIAPAIRSADGECKDRLEPREVSWSCEGNSWRAGGPAVSDPALTSFDFMDEVLRRLADKSKFPNLQVIVVAGHSAGGQFVSRYEMANRVHESLGARVEYVVANPSSYAWPDPSRALATGDADPAAANIAWKDDAAHSGFRYGAADPAKAPQYNQWPYGFEHRATGYAAQESDEQLKRQLAARPTTYLLGQVDTFPLGGFDDSPSAMAQGPTRRARGEAFVTFIKERLGAKASLVIVPECGHNDRCMFTSETALPVLFPALQ